MAEFIDASHNMLFRLNRTKWLADLQKSGQGDIVGYQEAEGSAQRTVLREWCEKHGRGLYQPPKTGCAISWRRTMFQAIPEEEHVIYVHRAYPDAKYMPGMDIVARGVRHIATKVKILAICIHATSGATKPEDLTPWGGDLDRWKNWALGQYYLDLVAFTARQMSREFYDVISLRGDYNAPLTNKKAWYYPGRMLPGLYMPDTTAGGIDHLQLTHGSDARTTKRWSIPANSDHRIHFATRSLTPRPDFPRVD